MPNKTMLILFPDGDEAANAEKITLISAYLAGDADIVPREPDGEEYGGIDKVDPDDISFRPACDEGDEPPPF